MGISGSDMSKSGALASSKPPVGPSSTDHDYYQGSATHRSGQSFDQESPSSLDSRSANSQSQEKHDSVNWDKQLNDKDGKKGTKKRKKVDTSVVEPSSDNTHQLDTRNSLVNPRNVKTNRVEPPTYLVKGGMGLLFSIRLGNSLLGSNVFFFFFSKLVGKLAVAWPFRFI